MARIAEWAAGIVLAALAYVAFIWRSNYRSCRWHPGERPGCPHCGGNGRVPRLGVPTLARLRDAWLDFRSGRL
jgi:hypothetical protein